MRRARALTVLALTFALAAVGVAAPPAPTAVAGVTGTHSTAGGVGTVTFPGPAGGGGVQASISVTSGPAGTLGPVTVGTHNGTPPTTPNMNGQPSFLVPLARSDTDLGAKPIGTMTITFTQAVTNPRLQVNTIDTGQTGEDGTYNATDSQLDILTPGVTFEKISGLDRYVASGTSLRIATAALGFRGTGTLQLTGTFSSVQIAIGLDFRDAGNPSPPTNPIPDARFTVTLDQDLGGGGAGLPASYGAASQVVGPATIGPSVTPDAQATLTTGPPVPFQSVDTNDAALDLSGLSSALAGSPYTLAVPVNGVPAGGMPLAGWIDFDRNGTFDASELATATAPPGATQTNLQWQVPATLASGPTWARFRLGASDGLPTGFGGMGEVEDVPVTVLSAPPVIVIPAEGQVVTTPQPTIFGTAEPGTTVTIRDGTGVVLCADLPVTVGGTWVCVPPSPLPNGPITLIGTTTGPGGTSVDSLPRTFVIDTPTDLQIAKALVDPTTPVVPGEQFAYELTATNLGPATASGIVISDTLPPGLSLVGSVPTGCTAVGQVVTCPPVASLAPAADTSVVLTVQLSSAYTGDGSDLGNTASVTSGGTDPEPDNDTTDPVPPPPIAAPSADLSVVKAAPTEAVNAGEETSWPIDVTNNGPSDALGVVVTDTLEVGLSFVSDDLGICTAVDQVVTCAVGTVAAGGSVTIVLTTLVASDVAAGTVFENTASVDATTLDPDPADNMSPPVEAPPVGASADLSVVKTAPTEAVNAGEETSWPIAVTNNGPSDALGVVVTDTLEAGLSFVSDDLGICSAVGQVVTCEVGTVAAADAVTIVLTTLVASDVASGTVFENVASASSTTPDPNPDNDLSPSVEAPPVETSADLSVVKTAPTETVNAGEETSWSVAVANDGPSDALGVEVTDTLETGLSFVSDDLGICTAVGQVVTCEVGTVAAGGSVTILLTTLVAPDVAAGTVFENVASASTTTPDPDPDNNLSPPVEAPPVETSADLSVVKTAPTEAVNAGEETSWSVTVTNNGPSDALGVVVTDTLEEGLSFVSDDLGLCSAVGQVVTCEVGTVAAADAVTIVLTTLVASDVVGGATFENTASVDATTPDPDPANSLSPPVTAPPVETSADLSVVKTAPTEAVNAGEETSWPIAVTNNGPSDARGVVVTDTLAEGLSFVSDDLGICSAVDQVVTCEVGTVAAADSVTIVLTTLVAPDVAAGTVFENVASASSTTPDPDPGNNLSPPVEAPPVEISADVSIVKTPPAVVTPGETIEWVLVARNDGPSVATGVVVTDSPQAGLSFVSDDLGICVPSGTDAVCDVGDLAVGQVVQIVLTTLVSSDVAEGDSVANGASIVSEVPDPDLSNNETGVVLAPANPDADLSVTKAAPTTPPLAGATSDWTVEVDNAGPSIARDAVLTDDLPAGLTFVSDASDLCSADGATVTCALGDLAPGSLTEVVLTTEVARSLAPGTVLENTATVASSTDDVDPGNNTATAAAAPSRASADVSATKTASGTPPTAGRPTQWTIAVQNAGPSDARGVVVTDSLPDGLSFVSDDGGRCSATGRTVTCDVGTVDAGGAATVVLTTLIRPDVAEGTTIQNSATASAETPDPNPDTNTSAPALSGPTQVDADLQIEVVAEPETVRPGEGLDYEVRVTNNGPSLSVDVVADVLAADHTAFLSAGTSGAAGGSAVFTLTGVCPAGTGGVAASCDVADLAPGDTVVVPVSVRIDGDAPAGTVIALGGRVGATTTDSVPGNNLDSDSVRVLAAEAPLGAAPSAPPGTPPPPSPGAPGLVATGTDVVPVIVGSALLLLLGVAVACAPRGRRRQLPSPR